MKKTKERAFLILFGLLLPEVFSQFDFWGSPGLSELINDGEYLNHEGVGPLFNNPQSPVDSQGPPNFIPNTLDVGKTPVESMLEQLGCKQSPSACPNTKYRSYDGSCNNLVVPAIGTPQTPYSRLLPPNYGDGFSAPRVAKSGNPLPLARLVSLTLHPDVDVNDPKFTLLAMEYGQFISHDMSFLIMNPLAVNCCLTYQAASPACYPITLPNNDPQTLSSGKTCMNFVRSLTDRDLNCIRNNKPAEQLTSVNHFLDLSLVYGNAEGVGRQLREFQTGRLRTLQRQGKEWLQQHPNISLACPAVQSFNEPCYFAGDTRSNQNAHLAALHILQLREHNRIAYGLSRINSHWDDERLYQEARRIAIAQHQLITYYEWIPIFLGIHNSIGNRLIYKTDNFVNDYDEMVNPAVSNEHANAAFRHFHSLIVGRLDLITENRDQAGALRLSDWFNRPAIIEEGNLDFLLRGVATQPESKSDEFLTNEITQYLFRPAVSKFGDDLKAIDIQRTRDHGLASYNDYRQHCGLPRANTFSDFGDVIKKQHLEKLASLYETPDDVDLTVGGSLEAIVEGALTGPTFLCIIIEQFYRTRVGDRFFFENENRLGGFTLVQLNEIRKASMSRLVCDNGDNIKKMQPHAFQRISEDNPVVSCDKLAAVDLNAWREEPTSKFSFY